MSDDPVALNGAGMQALQRGDFAGAAVLFRRAIAADSGAGILWYNLANALAGSGDDAGRADALDNALDCDPFMAHALLAKGHMLEQAGQHRDATEMYQRLMAALNPAEPMGPNFAAGVEHARQFLAATNAEVAARVDAAVADLLDSADPDAAMRFRHAVDVQLGRRRVYVHQPLVLNYPYLPAEQFLSRRHFPWFAELEAATPVIRAELQALLDAGGDGFAPYVAYPRGVPVNQWAPLNHNDAWAAQFLIQHGIDNDAVRGRCPQTAALLDRLPLFDCPGRGPVAFFSLLKPDTRIPPHTGATNIRTIVHLPLIVPEGCVFRVGNETRPWIEGEAFAFDDTIEHEAVNPTDRLRAVLIIDTWNPHIGAVERDLLRAYISALEDAGRGVGSFGAN